MPEDRKGLIEKVEQLAMQAMLVEPGDLGTLGAILNHLEHLEKMDFEKELEFVPILSKALRRLLEKLILDEMKDPQKGIDLLGDGIKLLQAKILLPDALQTLPEEDLLERDDRGRWDGGSDVRGNRRMPCERRSPSEGNHGSRSGYEPFERFHL